jgi:4-hydroxybenzoate polyprenyltransferase
MKLLHAWTKLLRLPGLGGLAVPPVFGALSVGMYDLSSLIVLFAIGCCAAVFGFVLNDYADVELDGLIRELRGKPLVSGAIQRKHAVAVCIMCVLLTYLLAYSFWTDTTFGDRQYAAVVSIFLAGVLGIVYNLYGKQLAGSDFLIALSMSLIFLFGALAFGTPTLLTWVIFVLTFNQTLHMNAVEGGIKDADHDHLMGVQNIALTAGVTVTGASLHIPWYFQAFGYGIRLASAALVFFPFLHGFAYEHWQTGLLALLIAAILAIEVRLLSMTVFDRRALRRLIAAAAFIRYAIVPVMLLQAVGAGAVLLVVLPILWYVALSPLTGVKPFQPEM